MRDETPQNFLINFVHSKGNEKKNYFLVFQFYIFRNFVLIKNLGSVFVLFFGEGNFLSKQMFVEIVWIGFPLKSVDWGKKRSLTSFFFLQSKQKTQPISM